ncbi:pyrimidine/purine nucleoside phosphorylase [Paradesertivirga mongoliensis]|uniref:Pyrimidine/purine nucleoside phosphorylase n=1 Tax=Paradesertivirga mongoliensis TaxID=2100740 RepID=A0ABW4ZPW3_9SPHI|nr:pyrimidine/purine nucleoside phosphorylase [Pedobacter mongoliensis]
MINVNEYFNGTVKSLGYDSSEGKSTIGVIEPGEYEFGTSSHETMIVIEGELVALLPGQSDWKNYKNSESFEVPANSSFKVKANSQTSYLCKYK